ncbi:hypothetical protein B0T10DRAFT_519632 [Thelonectria olida]|uniref:Ankyrin repeat protein n=1 Tax=Thelonectria olida TaxID=1576542 RepID=A0A9P9AMY2_9HYPO|nr:hypothetical protein B0T10DRAFT_519632 [Thelonectria olida]
MAVFRSGRHAAVVKLLLAHKADPGAKTKEQLTALHLAAMCGDRSRIDLILEHMSDRDVAAQTTDGSTALDLAFNGDNPAMALESLLKSAKLVTVVFGSAKAQEDALLWAAGSSATHEVVRLLLSKNSDTTKPAASKDWNAIQWAVYKQLPEVLWKLIASSPRTTIDSDGTLLSALEVMKKPAQKSETTQAAHTAEPSLEEKLENSAKKSTQDRIIGILKDPPTALSYRNQKRYDLPSFENKNGLSNLMQDFKASVVQFLETGTHSGSISRTRTVQDVIYDLGPKKIRLDAMADLRRNSGKVFSREDTANASNDGMSNLPQKRFINMEPDLTWVHLPSTNMVWMNDLLRRIMKDEGCNEEQFHEVNSFFRDSWVEIPDSTSASRTMRPRYVMRDPDTDDTGEGKKRTNKGYEGEDRWQRTRSTERPDRGHKGELAVYMPYLSFSIQRREPGNIDDEDSEDEDYMGTVNRKQPTPQEKERLIKVMKSHTELLESYQGHPIHGSSTLDEWYYHFGVDHDSVLDRDSRNMSQVATRCLSGSASVKGLEFWPLIRVNQLWIWTIANKWVITACPDSLDGSATTLVSEVLNHLDKQTEAGGIRDQPRTPTDMARFIVDHCVSSYERKPTAKKDICDELHSSVSIRQIFSKSINSLGRDETNLFKQFRKEIKKRQNRIQGQSNNEEKGPRIDEKIREAIIKAQKLSSHIKDIRDELNILKATAKYQKPIQDALSGDRAMQAGLTASYIVNDIEEMDNVADRLQSAVNTTLSLQQSEIANYQATIANSQAELSVQQGLEGMKQGRTLMVFTVITILFLPMSFLSSMFALDVASFQQAPWWAFVVIFVVSLVIFLPLAAYSIYSERFHEFWASQFGARGDGKTTDETKKHGSIGSLTLVQPSMDEPGSGQTGLEVAVNKRKPSRRWHHVEEGRGLSA